METAGVERGTNDADPKQPWNVVDPRKANENEEGTYQWVSGHPAVVDGRPSAQSMQRIPQKAEVKVDKREEATEGEQDVHDVGHNQRSPSARLSSALNRYPTVVLMKPKIA